jgi:hypothetical protein
MEWIEGFDEDKRGQAGATPSLLNAHDQLHNL